MLGVDIRKPIEGAEKKKTKPSDRIGENYTNLQKLSLDIVHYNGKDKYSVVFKDSGVTVNNVNYSKIINGQVQDPTINEPGLNGCIGVGRHTKSKRGKVTKAYKEWVNLIENYEVEESWRNFQNFADWFYDNYDSKTMKSWVLTNAIDYNSVKKGSKYFDPTFCTFLPKILVNTIFLKDIEYIGNNKETGKYSVKLKQFASKQKIGGFRTAKEAKDVFYAKKRGYTMDLLSTYKLQLDENISKAISKNADREFDEAINSKAE